MRISILAAIAAAGLMPGMASAQMQDERGTRIPEVRIHAPRAAEAGTTWRAPVAPMGTREEYRRGEPLYADEGYAAEYRDMPPYDDAYDRGYGSYYDDGHAYGVEDHANSDRFVRDDYGELDYDRDYPYDARYGNGGGGYYTIVETTVTTGPSVVTYAEEKKVAVHRAKRTVKKRTAYRRSGRAMGSKIRRLR